MSEVVVGRDSKDFNLVSLTVNWGGCEYVKSFSSIKEGIVGKLHEHGSCTITLQIRKFSCSEIAILICTREESS